MDNQDLTETDTVKSEWKWNEKIVIGTFYGLLGLGATAAGFGGAVKSVHDETNLQNMNIAQKTHIEAVQLARRALAIGSVVAICGVSLTSFLIWKIVNVPTINEYLICKRQQLCQLRERTRIAVDEDTKSEQESILSFLR